MRPEKYPLSKMQAGQYFVIPADENPVPANVRQLCYSGRKRTGMVFRYRFNPDGSARVTCAGPLSDDTGYEIFDGDATVSDAQSVLQRRVSELDAKLAERR